MPDAANRAALIATLRSLDRADMEAVVLAARSSGAAPAAHAVPTVRLTNTGRTVVVVESGQGPGGERRCREVHRLARRAAAAPVDARPRARPRRGVPAGGVRSVVLLHVRPQPGSSAAITVDLSSWRREAARLGWPVILVRSLGEPAPKPATKTSNRSSTKSQVSAPTWRLEPADQVHVALDGAGAQVLIVGTGPDLEASAEPLLALVRAAGESDTDR